MRAREVGSENSSTRRAARTRLKVSPTFTFSCLRCAVIPAHLHRLGLRYALCVPLDQLPGCVERLLAFCLSIYLVAADIVGKDLFLFIIS